VACGPPDSSDAHAGPSACDIGRIECTDNEPRAREVRAGDLLLVKNEGGDFEWRFWPSVRCAARRGAQTLYRGPGERELRLKLAQERKAAPHFEALREGRPSKRDRQNRRLRRRCEANPLYCVEDEGDRLALRPYDAHHHGHPAGVAFDSNRAGFVVVTFRTS